MALPIPLFPDPVPAQDRSNHQENRLPPVPGRVSRFNKQIVTPLGSSTRTISSLIKRKACPVFRAEIKPLIRRNQ